jgi:hypothetical protein
MAVLEQPHPFLAHQLLMLGAVAVAHKPLGEQVAQAVAATGRNKAEV